MSRKRIKRQFSQNSTNRGFQHKLRQLSALVVIYAILLMSVVPMRTLAAEQTQPILPVKRNLSIAKQSNELKEANKNASKIAESNERSTINRAGQTATELENGDVLIVGGSSAEIYFAASGKFGATGSPNFARENHAAVRLSDGRVLISGGSDGKNPLRSTEIFDPANGSFTPAAEMNEPRSGHTATVLPNGKIIIIGNGNAEFYDPAADSFAPIGSAMKISRFNHSAALLDDGRILIVGGTNEKGEVLTSAEIFDPSTNEFSATGEMASARKNASLRKLPDGKIQIIGGASESSMEVFDPNGAVFGAHTKIPADGSEFPELFEEIMSSPTRAAVIGKNVIELSQNDQALVYADGNGQQTGKLFKSSKAAITTEALNYPAGSAIVVSGKGFQPSETVEINFYQFANPDKRNVPRFTVQTDANGTFRFDGFTPEESNGNLLIAAKGAISGEKAQTPVENASPNITQIGFNPTGAVSTFTVGVSNPNVSAGTGFRVRTLNSGGTQEQVSGSGQSVTVELSSSSPNGQFSTNSAGPFSAILSLSINTGSANTPNFYYRDTSAGTPTLTATVTAKTSAVTALPVGALSNENVTVNKANSITTIALTAGTNPSVFGEAVSFTATSVHATGGAGTPSGGTVNFKDGASIIGTETLNGSGQATLTLSILSAGLHSITAEYGGDSNFNASNSGAISHGVDLADQTIVFEPLGNKNYGDADFTVEASGGDSGNPVTFTSSGSCTVTSGGSVHLTGAGSCTITAAQAGNSNYNPANPVSQAFMISPKSLTATVTVDSKIYDGNTSATISTRTLVGVINSDDVSATGGTATFNNKNVGTDKIVSVSGMTLSGTQAGNYTFSGSSSTEDADITPATLTVTAIADDKTYDGDADAVVTISDNRISGDDVTVIFASASFDNSNAGIGKIVTVSGVAITGGADAGNYVLALTPVTDTADINPLMLTVSVMVDDKIYDGNTSATILSRTPNGVIGADDVTVGGGTAIFSDKNVGIAKSVSVTGLTLGGTSAGNYSIDGTANTNADITAKSLTVTASAQDKQYDGNRTATVTLDSADDISGDDVTFSFTESLFDTADAGTGKTVTVSGISLGGADSGNYLLQNLTATDLADIGRASSSTSFTSIAPATLRFDETYQVTTSTTGDGATTVSASPLSVCTINSSNLVRIVAGSGTCTITAETAQGTNYLASSASPPQVISADKAPATITFDTPTLTQTYNGTPRVVTATTDPSGLTGVSITYDGSPTPPSAAGSYTVVASLTNDNYAAPNQTGTLVVGRASSTTSFTSIAPPTLAFDQTYTPTATTTGDGSLTISASPSSVCTFDGTVVRIVAGSGTCTVTATTAQGSNFDGSSATQTISAVKATATVTLSNLTQSYNGSPRSVSVATAPTGLESSVTVTYDGSPVAPTNGGSYAVIATLVNDNYEAADTTGTLIISSIGQTITFDQPDNKVYGDADFSLSASTDSGLAISFSSNSLSVCTVSSSTVHIVSAGTCSITASQAGNENYDPASVVRTFSVAKAPLSVTADNQTIMFGESYPPFTFSYGSFVNSETSAVIDTPPTCSVSGSPSDAGTYPIVCAGGDDNNYSFSYTDGTFTISRASQTISFTNPGPKTYGDADFGLTATGGASGNPVVFVSSSPSVCSVSGSTVHIESAGTCVIDATQAGTPNYDAAPLVQQSFAIGKADATISVVGGTFPYDGDPHGATGTATGEFSEDLSSLLDLGAAFTNVPGGTANWTFAGNGNYNSASGSANIVITAAPTTVTVTFESGPYVYRGTPFTATARATGTELDEDISASIVYSGDCTNVTSPNGCTATASFAGDTNHAPSTSFASITIGQATPTVTISGGTFTYDGNPHPATGSVTGVNSETFTPDFAYTPPGDATAPINAGTYAVVGSFAGNTNYNPATSSSASIVIGQASTTTTVTFASVPPYIYNGMPFTATARVTGAGGLDQTLPVSYTGDCTNVTSPDGCTASASFAGDSNYASSSDSESITITPASATLSLSNLAQTYDGTPKPVTVTTNPVSLSGVSVLYSSTTYPSSATAPSNAGSYDVLVSLSNTNYDADDVTGSLVISSASQTITFGALGGKTYGDADFSISATASSMLDVSFSSLTSTVCTVSSSTVHIVSAGECTLEASQAGNTNYEPAPLVQQSFTVAKATPTVSVSGGTFTYDGNPHPATGSVTGVNSETFTPDFAYTPPGDATAPINAGTYAVVGSFAGNDNYNPATSSPATIVIGQASQTITFGALPARTYGDAPFTVSATGGGSGNPVMFAASGNCTVSGDTVTLTGAGSCTITASQAGNSNYTAAPSVPRSFTINPNTTPVDVFIESPLSSQLSGSVLTVPVRVLGTSGHDIEAFIFKVNYDSSVLTPLATPFDQTGTISTAFTVSSSVSGGQLTILGDSVGSYLVGGGVLVYLKFSVTGAVNPGDLERCISLSLSDVRLNETVPFTVGPAVPFCVINGTVSGKITYPNSPTADFRVPGVTLTADDGINTDLTAVSANPSGTYSLSGFYSNNYTVTPVRSPDLVENVDENCGAISGSDVTRIRNYLLNPSANPLTPDQLFAADVSGNGDVSAFDVSQIRRYIFNQTDPNAGSSGTWKFQNPSESYTPTELQQSSPNEDYKAYLMGDVTGNWTPTCSSTAVDSSKENGNSIDKQSRIENLGAPVNVTVTSLSASSATGFSVPIRVDDTTGLNIEAYQFDVTYDPAVIQPQAVAASNAGTLSSNMTITSGVVAPGRLRILADSAGTLLAGSGTLLRLNFTAVGANGTSSDLNFFSFRFNEGVPTRVLNNGLIRILEPTSAETSVSGRVLDGKGNGIAKTIVTLTDSQGAVRSVITNSFGNYKFANIAAGESYVVEVQSKKHNFTPPSRTITANGSVSDVDFTSDN